MSSLLVYNKVYELDIQSAMLVCSTQLCELMSNLSGSPPPFPKSKYVYTGNKWLFGGRGGGVELCYLQSPFKGKFFLYLTLALLSISLLFLLFQPTPP
jgi:hypothetical protein